MVYGVMSDGHMATILLVEDEAALRELVAEVLGEWGHTVLAADCGEAALAVAERHRGRIDLLLTDVVMPGINGRQLASQLTRLRPETKVLYMSGHPQEARRPRGACDAGTRLIPKPFSSEALAKALREVLDGGEPHRAEAEPRAR
jgi:CheY-like chemotaxis protein